jgi:hypothetical protein
MNKLIVLIFLTLFFSCEQQEEKQTSSKFNLQADVQNIVQGTEGSILIIPANSFVYEDGTAIKESITLELTEAYDLKSILRNGLDTRTSKGLLVTGGMINLKATTASNKEVVMADDKEVTLQVGERLLDSNTYQFFSQEEGVWADPEKPSSYLTYLPIKEHTIRYIYGKKDGEYWTENNFIFTKEKEPLKGYELYDSSSFVDMCTSPSSAHLFKKLDFFKNKNLLDKSFIASKEYEDRFLAMLPYGEQNYDIHITYLKNLDKPLWVVDSMILEKTKVELEQKKEYEDYENDFSYQRVLENISILTKFKNQYKTTLSPERFNEEDLEKLKKYYSKLRANEFVQSYRIKKLGWHKIDYIYRDKLFLTELTIECTQKADRVAVLLQDVKIILQSSEKESGQYCLNRDKTCGIQLPKGNAYVVALTENDGVLLFGYKEITLGKDTKVKLNLQRSSEAEVTKIMESIH